MPEIDAPEPDGIADAPVPAPTPEPGRWRRNEARVRLLLFVVPLVVLWGVPEVALRLFGPPLNVYRAIVFGQDANSYWLFETDPRLWWKLRPRMDLPFGGVRVRTGRDGFRGADPRPASRNVLCLGDSTSFGWRVEESQTYPSQLEALLNRRPSGGAPWQAINAGVPGYSSFQVRLRAEKLLPRWRPDAVVIAIGNNEAWPVLRGDAEIDASRWLAWRVETVLSYSDLAVWTKERLQPQRLGSFVTESLAEARERVTPEETAENLRAVIRAARGQGARVVVVEPPVNLFALPLLGRVRSKTSPEVAWCREVRDVIEKGDRDAGFAMIEDRLAADPRDVFALWMKGIALTGEGRAEEGREWMERSLDASPFPGSSTRRYRGVIERVSREEGAAYVASNDLYARAAGDGAPNALFLDNCHPTGEGYGMLAREIAELLG